MLKQKTRELQNSLGSYCRGASDSIVKEHSNEKLSNYKQMVWNVVYDSLSKVYPISRQIIGNEKWNELVEFFFAKHKCRTNQIWKLPKEFIQCMKIGHGYKKANIPYLMDLLRFEWCEVEVFMMRNRKIKFAPITSSSENRLTINPYLKILTLNHPVHLLKKEEPLGRKTSHILCYRGWEDFRVYYLEISVLGKHLINCLKKGFTLKEITKDLLGSLIENKEKELCKETENFFQEMINKQIILGRRT